MLTTFESLMDWLFAFRLMYLWGCSFFNRSSISFMPSLYTRFSSLYILLGLDSKLGREEVNFYVA